LSLGGGAAGGLEWNRVELPNCVDVPIQLVVLSRVERSCVVVPAVVVSLLVVVVRSLDVVSSF
jgi:hypothetical protein